MEWEHGRNLIKSVTTATTSQVVSENKIDIENEMVYTYDAEGIRTGRTYTTRIYRYAKNNGDSSIASVGETAANETYSRYLAISSATEHKYVTQNGKVVRETVISDGVTRVLDYIYDESGRPSSVIFKDGTADKVTYYYVLNLQGDVEKIIDANGEVQAQYTYDLWGKILSITDDDGDSVGNTHIGKLNSLRYRGYCSDTETHWYYLQSRYYDPVTHRFINADSIPYTGQGIIGTNMFAYCGNNPIRRIDVSGNWWLEDAWDWMADGAEDAWEWTCSAAEDAWEWTCSAAEKAVDVGEAFFECIDAEAAIGMGLYAQAEFLDILGGELGVYGDVFAINLSHGELTVGTSYRQAATLSTIAAPAVGGASGFFKEYTGSEKDEYCWSGIETGKESIDIIGGGGYFIAGARFNIAFNFSDFFKSLDEIFS